MSLKSRPEASMGQPKGAISKAIDRILREQRERCLIPGPSRTPASRPRTREEFSEALEQILHEQRERGLVIRPAAHRATPSLPGHGDEAQAPITQS